MEWLEKASKKKSHSLNPLGGKYDQGGMTKKSGGVIRRRCIRLTQKLGLQG